MCGLFRGWGENRGRFETCLYGWSVGGGEIGMYGLFRGWGEIGVGCVFSLGVGEIGGRFETCPYRCFGCEVLELFELALDVREGRLVVVGWGRRVFRVLVVAAVVVAVVVARGAAAASGAVFLGHLGSEEHGEEGGWGVGLPSAIEK